MRISCLFAIALTFQLPNDEVHAQTISPVQFARGSTSSRVDGSIRGYDYLDYRLAVRGGQQLSVSLRTVSGSPYFNVMEPGSKDVAIYNSSMGEQRYGGTWRHLHGSCLPDACLGTS